MVWIAPESLCECYDQETASCKKREKDGIKESVSMRIVWVEIVGERRSQQILILLNDTLAHGLDVLLMSLVCGYGVEPDRLHSQTEGSSVRSHCFFLLPPFLYLIFRKEHVTLHCLYQSRRRLTWKAPFQSSKYWERQADSNRSLWRSLECLSGCHNCHKKAEIEFSQH